MYIGKLGDGSATDDGIYVLVKEIVDNSIDEYVMGNGKKIEIYYYKPESILVEGVLSVNPYVGIEQSLIALLDPPLNDKNVAE